MSQDIIAIIKEASQMGAAEAIKRMKPEGDRISQRQAEREYGRGFLKQNADRLTVTMNGNRREYSRAELEQVKAARNVAVLAVRIETKLYYNQSKITEMENKQPKINAAIAAIMAEIGAVKKESYNQGQRFYFRGIDQVMNELHPLLAKHGVAIVPEVLNYHREERKTSNGGNLIFSVLKIRYHFTADDGSEVCATVIGEGMDSGDKASNKAMAVAFKYACFQVFCIPTEEIAKADPDSYTPEASEITEAQLITFINNCDSVADLKDLATMYEANIKGNPAAMHAYQEKKGEFK